MALSTLFRIGPDGLLLVEASIVSVLVAVLAWRRVGLTAGLSATLIAAVTAVIVNAMNPQSTPGLNFRIVTASFIIVPSLLLLGASRQRWIARHAWALLLLGPVLFAGCYVGICELCVKTGVI